ncbi:MAG: hypothetical protein WCX81_01965 [Monoglobales bacterium]
MYISMIKNPLKMIKHPKLFWEFYIYNFAKIARLKITKKNRLFKKKQPARALHRDFLRNDEYNNYLKERISDDKPFFSCRYGNSELVACFISELYTKKIIDRISPAALKKAKSGPGVFPATEETYLSFADHYTQALKEADSSAYWEDVLMEEYLINQYIPKEAVLYKMRALEPFSFENPWTMALRGKRVLVVHPFSDLIISQYQKRDKLFSNPHILPEFNLEVVQAVQSSGDTVPDNFENWTQALDGLWEECKCKEYDVALLACGSYAVPLAARMKKQGKKAIVLGGMLQLIFGIKGARWEESRPDIVDLYNEQWVRATQYKVKDADKMVDGPAYW